MPLRPEFVESFPDVLFDSRLDQAVLDEWVARATGGLLRTFPIEVDESIVLALGDALVLRAGWAKRFSEAATAPAPFTRADGTAVSVPMMRRTFGAFSLHRSDGVVTWEQATESETEGSAVVRFALGDPELAPAEVLRATWRTRDIQPVEGVVRVVLPRFGFTTATDLAAVLAESAAAVCLSDAADFSGLSPERLAITSAAQQAMIRVDEKGFEAAAVSAAGMRIAGLSYQPPVVDEVVFDRPFGFSVIDPATQLPLFTGWVADPC